MNTKIKKLFCLIIFIVSLCFIGVCSLELLDNMITYKYHIEHNINHIDTADSYESRKIEIEIVMNYIKIFIVYLLVIICFFSNNMFKKYKVRKKEIASHFKKAGLFNSIITVFSMLMLAFLIVELFIYIADYNSNIRLNIEHKDIIRSYSSHKLEMDLRLAFLKTFLIYLMLVTLYFFRKTITTRWRTINTNE
jgi:heme/copper-type cytochrome/quinol oxidase subunit 2